MLKIYEFHLGYETTKNRDYELQIKQLITVYAKYNNVILIVFVIPYYH